MRKAPKRTFKSLNKDESIPIIKADKGSATLILNSIGCVNEINDVVDLDHTKTQQSSFTEYHKEVQSNDKSIKHRKGDQMKIIQKRSCDP